MSGQSISNIVPKIILASASAIRAELMTKAGIEFEIRPTDIDEDILKAKFAQKKQSVKDLVQALAYAKANAINGETEAIIIGADQVLEFNGQIFDKPKTMRQAEERLKLMRGQEHRLIGGLCVLQSGSAPWYYLSTTKLHMRKFSDEFLKDYLQHEGESVLACVGAYKFEGRGASLFERVEGDFFSILGLSLLPLMKQLRSRGALLS